MTADEVSELALSFMQYRSEDDDEDDEDEGDDEELAPESHPSDEEEIVFSEDGSEDCFERQLAVDQSPIEEDDAGESKEAKAPNLPPGITQLPAPGGVHNLAPVMQQMVPQIMLFLRNRGYDIKMLTDLVPAGLHCVRFQNLYVRLFLSNIGIELIRSTVHQQQTTTRKFILVIETCSGPALDLCQQHGIEVIKPSLLMFNILEHTLMGRDVKIIPDPERYVRDPERLPTISAVTDPLALWLNAKHGSYIHVMRPRGLRIWRVIDPRQLKKNKE